MRSDSLQLRAMLLWISQEAAHTCATTESPMALALDLVEFGLLVRSKNLVESGIGFGFRGDLLRRQVANRDRDLVNVGSVVTLHRIAEALVRCL